MQRVIFRKWRTDGEITAYFPDQREPNGLVTCYAHIGQHGMGSYPNENTKPASEVEYAPLLAELRSIGYDDLRIVKRVSR